MTNPFVSVIIPTYNRANTIGYCLDSVANQTYKNIEIIVVDDCSTDGTVGIVKKYPDVRVRCIVLENNGGAQRARNRGIQEAKGEWIAFQDSDDEWMPEKLEKQVEVLSSVNFDESTVVHTNVYKYYSKERRRELYGRPYLQGKDVYAKLLAHSPPIYQTMLTSKKALISIGGLNERVIAHQEWETSLRLSKSCQFLYVDIPLVLWYKHEGEQISKNVFKNMEGYFFILQTYERDIKTICGEEKWESHLRYILRDLLDHDLIKDYDRFRKRILENYRLDPQNINNIYIWLCRLMHIRPSNALFNFIKNHFKLKQ